MALLLSSSFFSLPISGDVNEIDTRCVLTPKLPLLATEKYQQLSLTAQFLLFFLSSLLTLPFSLRGTTIIYVLCGMMSKSPLPVREIYEYTSAPWRRGIVDVSRGTKSKAGSGKKGSPPQDESGSRGMKTADLFQMLSERVDSHFEIQNKKFKAL